MSTQDQRPVVVGADGTAGSSGALHYGVREAVARGVLLHLVHVMPVYPPMAFDVPVPATELRAVGTTILEETAQAARDLAPDLEVTTELGSGSRSGGVVEASQGAQLVVVGRETRHGIDRVLTGTTTASVAAHAPCPVVVVPSTWSGDPVHGRVVAGIKSRPNAPELLSHAFAAARTRGAALTLVTAWEVPDPYLDRIEVRTHEAEWTQSGTEVLESLVTGWRGEYADVPVDIRVVHGHAANVLLDQSRDSDLLMVSRRRHAIPPHGHLGGTPRALLRVSDVPVEVVPFVLHEDVPE